MRGAAVAAGLTCLMSALALSYLRLSAAASLWSLLGLVVLCVTAAAVREANPPYVRTSASATSDASSPATSVHIGTLSPYEEKLSFGIPAYSADTVDKARHEEKLAHGIQADEMPIRVAYKPTTHSSTAPYLLFEEKRRPRSKSTG